MNDKYFVPDIEDFRFGYEFEKNYSSSGGDWYPTKIIAYLDFEGLDFYIEEGLLRTPYLTKEQIEAEGWIHEGGQLGIGSKQIFNKNEFVFNYSELNHKGEIKVKNFYRDGSGNYDGYITHYKGEIKSINEFRFICKLLKIDKE